ncbi:uncharacterized protein LOC144864098 isoform X5 [Branchiostoma floridae x Branchiostoma japonicum]
MASLSLKISVKHANVVKTMQFEPSTIVYDACRMIRERIPEAQMGNATEFGMFLADEDPKKGVWLEAGRTLDYYLLRSGDLLEYKKKHRPLKVRMLDGTVKTVMVDDSHTVAQLLVTICTRIGITNHDEYSLVREGEKIREAAEPPTPVKKVGGISDRTLMRDEKKMEALKKKLHTDDELNWLDHGRTLREQGIDDTETLLLRRKFFYSDQNVDSRDPVQLNLLYVQARDGILNGTHPVTVDEAMMFAAYQTQIQFGDHIETKHKSGFLDLKEFLPKEYVKNKGIEKKIWLEHRKLAGLSELDAKVRYTQQCRSLKTYGVTFFLVKEKMKGKNKLVPRLLGITKDSVMRVDEKTKEILKVWPLTTVRRWAASPKSFTLDFGDYSESYYSVQTTEGETISQLIAGYIDIILRKKKGKDRFGLDGEEESTMLEDSVSPARATIMQHQENKVGHVNEGSVAIPAVMRAHDGAESYSTGTMPRAEYATIRGQIHSAHMPPINTQAQQALMGNISSGFNSISAAQAELGSRAELPPLGSDPASLKWKQNTLDVSKQNVTSQLAAMSAATASVVTLTSDDWKKLDLKHQKIVDRFRGTPNNVKGEPEQTDYTAVGSAVTTISSNLTEMSKGIKMVAALLEDYGQGERLLDAARNLAGAFSDLLSAAKPGSTEGPDLYEACRQLMIAEHEFLDQIQPYLPGPRQNLLTAAGNIGEHGREVLHEMGEVDTDPRFQDALMALAKAVANATATLVLKAKNVASKAEDPAMQNKVIASATQTALSTSQLVACTKVVAPTISHPACQEQLIDAAKLVAKSVEKTVDSAQMATQEEFLLKDLGAAATQVTQALNDLLQHIKQASKKAKKPEKIEEPEPEELESTDDEKRDSEKSDEEDEEERRRREEEERLHRERVMGDLNTAVRNVLDQLGPEDAAVGGDLNDAVRRVMKTTSDLLSEIKFEPKPEEIEEPPQVTTTVVATRESVDGGRRNEALLAELDLVVRMAMDQMSIGDDGGGSDLNDAVRRVVRRLNDLLSEIKFEAKGGEQYEDHCDTIISASDRLFASMGNASDMIKQAKILAEATSHLVNSIKTSADTTDDTDSQKRLLGAAKVLADATARMVEAAKGCAVNPHDSDEQENLRKAAEDLRAATNAAAGNAIKKKLVSKLETSEETVTVKTMTFTKVKLTHYDKDLLKKILEELQNAAKHAAAVATQTIAASQAAASSNKNPSSQQQLVSSCKHVADHIPRLVQGVRGSRAQPDSPSAQLLLINASQEFISPANNMNSAAKAAVPTVSDQAASMQLSNCSKQLAQALAELRSSAQKAQDACGPLEIDSALDTIRQLDSDLVEIKKSAAEGQLVPLPDESGEQCAQELGHTSKTVGASMAQLLTAAAQGNENYTGLAARDTANALRTLTGAVRGVAAATSDRQAQDHLIDTARDVMDKSINLIEEAKKAVNDPNNPDNQQRLAQVAKAVSHALNNCVNCLPGQRDVDFAIRNIGEASKALLSGQVQNIDLTQYPGYYGGTYDLRPYGSPQGAEGYTIPTMWEGQQSEGQVMYQNGVPGMYGGQYGGQYGVPAMYGGQQVILLNGASGFVSEGDRVVNYGVQSGIQGKSFINVEELKPQELDTSTFTSMTSGSQYDTMSINSVDLDWNEVDFDQTVYNYGIEQGKAGQALVDLSALRQARKRKTELQTEVQYVEEERHVLNYGIEKNVSGKAIINLDSLKPPTKKVKRKKTKVEREEEEGEVIEWDDSDVETVATVESLTDGRREDLEVDERYDEERRRIRMQMEQPIVKRRTYHIDETDEDIHVDDSTPVFEAFFRYIGHGEPYPEKPKEKPVLEMPESDFTMPERLDPQLGQTKIEERKIRPQERNLDFEAFFRHYMEEARRRMETPTVTREWVKVPGDEDLPKDTVKPNFDAFFRNYPDLEPAEQVEEKKKEREEIPTYETEDDLTIRSTEEVVRGKVEEKPAERSYIWPNFDEFFRSYPSMAKGREFGIQCNVKEEIDSPRMRKIGVLQRYRRLVRVAAKRYNLVLSSKIKVARVCKEFHLSATRLVVSVLSVFSKINFGASSLKMEDFTIFNQHLQKGDVSFQEVQTMLSTAAQELNMASSELVVASKGTHEQLAQASGKFSKDFSLLLEAGMQMAAQTSDEEQQSLMVSNLKSISMSSSKLLLAAKSLSADPNAPNAKNQLASAARSVTDSINQLINICMQTAPGQKECDNALRNIETVTEITEVHTSSSSVETTETRKVSELKKDMEMHIVLPHPDIITKSVEVYISHFNSQTRVMRSMLDNPMEPVNDLTYFDCLETVMDKSKTLGESMSSITQHAKNSEHEEFGSAVTRASTAVCGLTEAAAQTAYLVGIADPSSQAGRQGLVDQSQFARANQAIQMACQQLLDPTTSQAQVRAGKSSTVTVLSAATVIAKHTSSLCNMCRVASTKTSNPVAKRHFVQSAKEVANSTANLVKSIKALDGNFTEQNRQQVAEASRPLMEAVENLTTFASNPEFASVPAQISIEARKAQEPIVIAGRTIIDSTSSLITTAKLLAVNPKDPPTWQLLAGHSKTVSDSIKRLIASIRDKAPGQRECDRGIEVINQCIRDVDQASLSAVTQKLEPRNEGTTQIFQEQMNNAAHEIGKNVDGVASAAKEKAEKLGHQVTQLSSYFDPLASAAINLASKTMNSQKQENILEQTKTVAESALQLVYTSKEGGGNPKATHAHAAIDEAAEGMKEAVDDLLKTLDESASETGAVFGMVDGITKAMSDMVDGRLEDKPAGSFVDYQTKMVKIAKQLARTSHDMVGKASSSPDELGPQANALSHDFSELAAQSKGAMATINSPELSDRIRNSVQDLGNSCVDVVNNAGAIQSNPSDTYAKKDLIENSRAVSEKVSFVLASLQAGSRGTQACINAASTVSGIIGDLDTTIMFASAGTLSPEMEDEAFADHRENILKTAKALVEDTKTLVSGAASSQEHLAAAAQSAVDTITKLADAVKSGAASLGPQDAEAQVLLINAVKDVAVALGELIEATKNASGKPVQDPSMVQLKNSAKQLLLDIQNQYQVTKPNQPRWENYINSLATEQTKKSSTSRTYVTKTSTSQVVTTKTQTQGYMVGRTVERKEIAQDEKKAERNHMSLPPPRKMFRQPSPGYSDVSDTERTDTPVHELAEEPSENVFDIVKRFETPEMQRLYIEEGRDSPLMRRLSPSPRPESPLISRHAKSVTRTTEVQSPITYVVERVISPTADKSPDVDNGPTKALRPKSPTPESQPALFPGRKSPVPGRKSPLLRSQSPVPGKRSPLLGSQSPVPGKRSPLLGSQSPVPGKKSPIPGRLSPGDRPRSPYLNVVHSSTERPLTPEPHARTLDLRPLSPSWKGSDADGRMEKKVQFTKVVVRESTDRELENKLKKRREIADSVIVGEQPSEMGSGRGGEGGLVALLEDRVKVTAPDVEPEVYGSQSMVRSREAHKVSMEEKAPVCEVVQEESSFIPPCSTASPVGHPLPDDVPTVSEPSQLPRGYLATVSMQPPPPLPEPPAIHPADHLASVSEQPLPEPPVIHPYDHLATDSEPPAIHTPPLPEPPVIHSPDHLATVSELPVIPPPLFEPPSEALKPPDLVTEVDRVTEEVEALETVEMSTDLVPPPDVIEIKERKEEETSSISITTSTQQKQMETAETATASETVREEEGKDDTETSERSSYIGFDSPVPEEMAEVAEGGQKGVSPESLAKIAADKIQESELEESESDTDIEMCYDVTPGGLETIYELSDEQEDPHSMEFEHALENVQFDEESGRWFAATGLKPAFARKVLVQKKKQVEKIVEVKEEEIEEESKAETESMPTEAGKEEGLFRGLPIVRERKWDEKFRQEEEERIIKELAEEEERAIAFKKAEEERAIAFKKAEEERAIAFRKAEEERIAEEERQREEAKMFRGIPLVRERKWDERFRQEDERRLMMELSTTEAADLEVSKDEETGRDDVLVDDVSRQQPVELVEIPSLLEEEDDVFLPEKPAEILKEEPEMMPKEKTPSPPPQEDVKKVTTSSEATVVEKDVVQPDSEPTKDAVEDKPVQEPRITKTKPDEATVEKKGRVTAAEVAALPSFTGLKKTYAEVVKLGIMDKVGTQTRKEEYKAPSEMTTLLPKPQKKQSPSFEIDVQRKTTFETEFSRSPPKVQFEDITVVMEMSDEEMVQEEEQEASPAEEEQNLSQEPNLSQEASHSSFESETDFEVAKLWKRSEMAMMPGLEKGLEEGKLYEATNFGDKGEHDKVSTVEMLSKSPPKVRFSPVVEIIQTREIEQTMSEQLSSETNSSDEDESSASDAKDSDDHDSGGEAGGPAEEDAGGADEEKDDDDGPDERKDEEDADEDSREPTGEPEQDAAMLSAESELSASEDNLGEEVSSEMETDHDNDRDIFEELIQDNMKRMEELLHHKENLAQEKEQFHQQAALYSLAVKVSENRGAKRRLQRVTRSNTQALFGDDDDEEEQEEEDAEESAERSGMEQLEGRVMDVDTGSDSEWSKQLATGPGIEQLEIARKLSPQETLTTKSPEPAPEEASEEELEKVGSWNMESIIADLMQDYYLLEAEWDTEASETEASQDTSSEAAGPSASSQKHTAAVPDRAAREQYDGFPSPPDMSLLGQDGGGWGAEDATNKDHQEQYNQQRNDQSQVPLTEGTDIPWGGEEELPPPPFFDFSEEGAMEDYHRYYDSDSYGAARETAGASREFPAFDGQRGEARRGKGRGREGEESKEDELARMIRLASCELYGGADSPRIMHKQRSASDLMATDTSSIASSSRTASASDLAELLQEAASEDMEFLEKYSKEGRRVRKRKVRVESDFRSHLEKILRKRQEKMSEKGSSTPELVKMFRSESMESFLSKEPEEKKKKIGGSVPSSPVPSSPAPSSPVPRRREEEPLLQLQQLFTGRPPTGLGRGDRPKQLVLIRRKKNEP